jgi:DNA polymerase III epsilon subunit-like protein
MRALFSGDARAMRAATAFAPGSGRRAWTIYPFGVGANIGKARSMGQLLTTAIRTSELGESAWLVSVDLETTGLSPRADRVVQLAAVCEALPPATAAIWGMSAGGSGGGGGGGMEPPRPSAVPASFCTFVDPGFPIPPAASRVHGITDDDVVGAPSFAEAVAMLVAFLESEVARERHGRGRGSTAVCLYVVAHNGEAFDFPLFEAEIVRDVAAFAALGEPATGRCGTVRVLFGDTCLAARALREPLGLRSCTLAAVHCRLGGARAAARHLPLLAHDALGDATAVSDIMLHTEMFRVVIAGARERWWWLQ